MAQIWELEYQKLNIKVYDWKQQVHKNSMKLKLGKIYLTVHSYKTSFSIYILKYTTANIEWIDDVALWKLNGRKRRRILFATELIAAGRRSTISSSYSEWDRMNVNASFSFKDILNVVCLCSIVINSEANFFWILF